MDYDDTVTKDKLVADLKVVMSDASKSCGVNSS